MRQLFKEINGEPGVLAFSIALVYGHERRILHRDYVVVRHDVDWQLRHQVICYIVHGYIYLFAGKNRR